ncbi:MAG: TlpA disulfide reductase family protein [Leptospirales bacterium]
MKHLITPLFILASFILAGCGPSVPVWQPTTQFPLLNSDGSVSEKIENSISITGVPDNVEILVLNFFAPHCPPCIAELPELKEISKIIDSREKVAFYAIGSTLTSVNNPTPPSKEQIVKELLEFIELYKIDYPVYLAESNKLQDFGITGFPETIILYRNEERKWYIKRKYVSSINLGNVLDFIKL